MKRFIYAVLLIALISNVCKAEDYIKLGIESVNANTTVDIPFLIKRECLEPTLIYGASSGFVLTSTGTITWTWQGAGQYPESSVEWNLGGLYVLSDVDGISPDYFMVGGASLPLSTGMPIIPEEEPYFWVRLGIGSGDGEICIDSSYMEPSGVWTWAGLTCGEGGSPDRPLFVDYNGSDANHPICIPVEHVCNPPTITGKPPGDELTTDQCSGVAWTFTADPGDYDGVPATPLTWAVTSGSGSFTGDEYSCGSLTPGIHPVEIEVVNNCGATDAYTFDIVSENMDQQITNCTEAPPKIAMGEAYDFQFTTNEPCDPDQHFEITDYDPFIVNPPTIDDAGNFHWLTDVSEAGTTFMFEIWVLDAVSYQSCEFTVLVVDPPDFYLMDCASDLGYPVPSGCFPFWTCYEEHGIDNMDWPHGEKLVFGEYNNLVTTVHNRGGYGDGTDLDQTARVFAYWIECADNLQWPMSHERRIIDDPDYGHGETTNYVEVTVEPGHIQKIRWKWLAPTEGEVVPGTDHLCVGFVINPTEEPEGMTSPTIDYDKTDGRFHAVHHNNVAQINLRPERYTTPGPKSKSADDIKDFTVPVWNFSEEPITVIPQIDMIYLGGGWSVDMDQTDSLYVPSDTCVFVDLSVTIPAQAPDNDSTIFDFVVIETEQYETVGGTRFDIRIDNDAPKPVSTLEALCADFMPDCCRWLPPEICMTMGARVPLQWEIPDYDVDNESERVWFFILCRSGSPDVGLGDQIDSVAADFSRDDPGFQWIDADIELGETYYYCVYVVDEAGNMSDKSNVIQYSPYICGDNNNDGQVDIDDVVCLIQYIFVGQECVPDPLVKADVDCDGFIDIDDVVYLISFIFAEGPAPCEYCVFQKSFGKDAHGSVDVNLINNENDVGGSISLALMSDVEIQGAQFEFSTDGTVNDIAATTSIDGVEVFSGMAGDRFRVGLVDLEGRQMIPSDNTIALTVDYSGDGHMALEDQIIAAKGGGKLLTSAAKQSGLETLPFYPMLDQNYPNPFNPSTEIRFSLPEASDVVLEIFNIIGQRVTRLVNTHLPAGTHTVTWNGRCDDGSQAASGVYFYRLEADKYQDSKKMLLLK